MIKANPSYEIFFNSKAKRYNLIFTMKPIEWLKNNKFTLCLSSGYFGFFHHLALMKVFEAEKLVPQKLMGSSAGAIVGAGWGSGIQAQDFFKIIAETRKQHIWDPSLGLGINRGELLHKKLSQYIKADFDHAEIPVTVSAFNLKKLKTERFSSGDMVTAARASAAFPIMFQPVKMQDSYYWDGGINDKSGLFCREEKDKNVFCHFLLSQTPEQKWDLRRHQKMTKKQDLFFATENTPKIGPALLHKGAEIYEASAKKIQERLYLDI